MDEKTAESIKDNKGVLRQFTYLNDEIEKLKIRVRKLEGLPEEISKDFARRGFSMTEGGNR